MAAMTRMGDLLGPEPVLLPANFEAEDALAAGKSATDVAAAHPTASVAWAALAEAALADGQTITAYAYARTGYHRGLDALRRAGWRGKGPIPWGHEPNQGFLRALWALASAAYRIGEQAEYERCVLFLLEASEEGYVELATSRPLTL